MTVHHELGRVAALVWKDLTAERRSKANFNAVVFLAALTLLLFGFGLGPDPEALRRAAAGILWLTVLFSGVLSFNHAFDQELRNGALETLLLYPGDRRSIFVGKFLATLTFLLLVEALLLPAAAILYGLDLTAELAGLAAVLLLGTVGFVALGTFYASMVSRLRAREVLLPLLLFPMLVPLLVAAVESTAALLAGDPMGSAGAWIRLLVVFDVIFFTAAFLAFPYVIEE